MEARALRWIGGLVAAAAAVAALGPGSALAVPWRPEPATYSIGQQQNVPVTMADGTVLRVDVYYPVDPKTGHAARGKFPVILTQTPYGKDSSQSSSGVAAVAGDATYLPKRGYIEVIADVRGTGASQGTWGLFDPIQGEDGAHLVRWAARLPHSSGKVGTLGPSYLGINQLLTAAHLGAHSPLKAMFPIIAGNDIYRDTAFDGGIVDSEFGLIYYGLTGSLNVVQPLLESLVEQPSNPDVIQALIEHVGGLLAYHAATIANVETNGDEAFDGRYWRAREPRKWLGTIVAHHIPAFLVGGWFDLFQRGEPLNYAGLQNAWAGRPVGRPMKPDQPTTGRYQLLMGPWFHLTAGTGIDLNRIELAWFDRWLKHENTDIERTHDPLHLYQLGSGKWLQAAHYPFDGAKAKTYYLGPGGTLGRTKPGPGGGADQLVWTGLSSPCGLASEQWSMGTLNLLLESAGGSDPCLNDDSTTQTGPGSATYTTKPFAKPRVLAGPIDATLRADSSTSDAEFVVNVEDVSPDGSSKPLTSGALLGSFRKLSKHQTWWAGKGKPLIPYHPYTRGSQAPVPSAKTSRFDVEIFPTFARLGRGHRLRVTITTSDVPHLLPTPPNIQKLIGGVYHVQHNASAPSLVELPLARPSAYPRACGICH